MSEEQKPDGWVVCRDFGRDKRVLPKIYKCESAAWRYFTGSTREQLEENGWRIRPVKLVFLDEQRERGEGDV